LGAAPKISRENQMAMTKKHDGVDGWIQQKYDEVELKIKTGASLSPEDVGYLMEYHERHIVDEKEQSFSEGEDAGAERYSDEIQEEIEGQIEKKLLDGSAEAFDRLKSEIAEVLFKMYKLLAEARGDADDKANLVSIEDGYLSPYNIVADMFPEIGKLTDEVEHKFHEVF
jgi:hypothetical protein